MAINLIRNSRVFFTTNVNSTTGVIQTSGFTVQNTWEIQVLDGFSFTQNTNAETVTLNEAGATPNRGQRSFNTSLAPVDFSFSTYVRPSKRFGSHVVSEETFLWNALVSNAGTTAYLGSTSIPAGGAWTSTTTKSTLDLTKSQAHQLVKFGLIIQADSTTYLIDDCCMNQASIDFGIDQISTIAWSGMGKALRRLTTAITLTDVAGYAGSFTAGSPHVGISGGGGYAGSALAKDTSAGFIANKLSTAFVGSGLNYAYIGSGTWGVPITAGNITINNNISYLTPAILGVVNEPAQYFTGTRSITGTLTAYLKSGTGMTASTTGDTGDLMTDILSRKSSPDNKYTIQVDLGGITNSLRGMFRTPAAVLQVPTVKAEQVMGVDINFTGQGYASQNYDIEQTNEFTLEYYAP